MNAAGYLRAGADRRPDPVWAPARQSPRQAGGPAQRPGPLRTGPGSPKPGAQLPRHRPSTSHLARPGPSARSGHVVGGRSARSQTSQANFATAAERSFSPGGRQSGPSAAGGRNSMTGATCAFCDRRFRTRQAVRALFEILRCYATPFRPSAEPRNWSMEYGRPHRRVKTNLECASCSSPTMRNLKTSEPWPVPNHSLATASRELEGMTSERRELWNLVVWRLRRVRDTSEDMVAHFVGRHCVGLESGLNRGAKTTESRLR